MKFWKKHATDIRAFTPHEFVIGPPSKLSGFERTARLYYCFRCKGSFVVCGTKVAVLDAAGEPLRVSESADQYDAFIESRCPGPTPETAPPPLSIANLSIVTRKSSAESQDKISGRHGQLLGALRTS